MENLLSVLNCSYIFKVKFPLERHQVVTREILVVYKESYSHNARDNAY